MIDSILIKQFRCYKDCSIKGFKRINLIGGLNNAGKTIFFYNLDRDKSIFIETEHSNKKTVGLEIYNDEVVELLR